jgi:hypothetical protein
MPSSKDREYRIARAAFIEAGNELYAAKAPKARSAARKKYNAAKKRYHTTGNALFRSNG